jgi:transposase
LYENALVMVPQERRKLHRLQSAAADPIHRSALVKNHVAFTQGRIVIERLPAYAPELNPVEYMWGQLKTHEIANLIATKAWELSFEATAALRRMRRRRSIIAACYTQADLWP